MGASDTSYEQKLGPMEVASIRREYERSDISQRKLAERYGVGKSTIGDIVRYETWPDVDPDSLADGPGNENGIKWVPGWEGLYAVTEDGRVFSYHGKEPRQLKTPPNSAGYLQCNLSRNGHVINRHVHVLVAKTFIGPRPDGMDVVHVNGERDDNRLENIRYGTRGNTGK